jgi:arylsulfatase A-like enzyme
MLGLIPCGVANCRYSKQDGRAPLRHNNHADRDRYHACASVGTSRRHSLIEMKASTAIVRTLSLLVCFWPAISHCETKPAPGDRQVVVIVWDGMRPDFVNERNTPTLWKLAQEGVTFQHHHSVYLTATNVNGAAMATGVYPNRNSLLANREFRPAIDPRKPFENAEWPIIKKADELTGGKYIAAPTIAETVRAAGRRTAIVGTKAVAFLHDRHAEWSSGSVKDFVRFAAAPMPVALREETVRLLGSLITEPGNTSNQRNAYATRALTEIMWRDALPAFSLLWLSEPDLTQHEFSPGAEPSLAAVRSSDRNLALVLEALEKKKARETTDIFVVSDHGFSTIERAIDFPAELRKAGFDATVAFRETPKRGQIMVVGNGGTILFYVIEHDRDVAARLVEWLQRSDFAGVIFAREKFEGTFPLETVRANTAEAPDVMVALRWNKNPNRFGVAGQIITDSARGPGEGSHTTLSEFDVHNTLIVAGPDFRERLATTLPSSNVDIAPTVLRILGIEPPQKFDGRVLIEGMEERAAKIDALTKTIQAARKFPSGEWQQYLRVSLVGETVYIDEGNGAFEPSTKKP